MSGRSHSKQIEVGGAKTAGPGEWLKTSQKSGQLSLTKAPMRSASSLPVNCLRYCAFWNAVRVSGSPDTTLQILPISFKPYRAIKYVVASSEDTLAPRKSVRLVCFNRVHASDTLLVAAMQAVAILLASARSFGNFLFLDLVAMLLFYMTPRVRW